MEEIVQPASVRLDLRHQAKASRRRTCCRRGHDLTLPGAVIERQGRRVCAICFHTYHAAWQNTYRRKRQAQFKQALAENTQLRAELDQLRVQQDVQL